MASLPDPISGPINVLDPIDRLAIEPGALACWRGLPGQAAGPRVRDLIGTRTGTLVGGASWGPTTRAGGDNQLNFDGTGYVQVRTGPILGGLAAWTIVAWARTTQANVIGGKTIYGERASSGNDILKLDSLDSTTPNGAIITYRDNVGTLIQVRGGRTINDDRWHHLAITRSGSAFAIYVDGVADGSGTYGGGTQFTDAVECRIGDDAGGHGAGNPGWQGGIDEVRLYARALTAVEIRRLFDSSRLGNPEIFNRVGEPTGPAATIPDITATPAETAQAATVALTGTNTPPARTGTLAEAAQAATVALVGTNTPPARTATLAEAGLPATVALAGTVTPPAITSTLAEAAQVAAVALVGTNTPPAIASTLAEVGRAATIALVGTNTPPSNTSSLAESGQAATVAMVGLNTPPARTATPTEAGQSASVGLVGTNTPPARTSTLAETGQAATVALAGTNTPPAITPILAETGQAATVALVVTNTPPAITIALAETGRVAVESWSAVATMGIVATPAEVGRAAIEVLAGTHTPPAIASALAEAGRTATVALVGTNTPPAIVSSLIESGRVAIESWSALALSGVVATLVEAGQAATAALVGTNTPPATTSTPAEVGQAATVALIVTGSPPEIAGALDETGGAAAESLTGAANIAGTMILADLAERAEAASVVLVGFVADTETESGIGPSPYMSSVSRADPDPWKTTVTNVGVAANYSSVARGR